MFAASLPRNSALPGALAPLALPAPFATPAPLEPLAVLAPLAPLRWVPLAPLTALPAVGPFGGGEPPLSFIVFLAPFWRPQLEPKCFR